MDSCPGAVKFKLPGHTPQSIIARGKAPLLLILDEAQELGQWKGAERTQENHELVQTFLDRIHNGKLASRPVMLIAGGLGTTKQAFKNMGVSRLKTNCYVDLEPLKPEEERKVIVDWLQLEGKAKGDPLPWIDAIAAEPHGWPQHIALLRTGGSPSGAGGPAKDDPFGIEGGAGGGSERTGKIL